MIVSTTFALVAQRQSCRLLTGRLQVRILPGALAKEIREEIREESEDAMERLISLFREPDYEQWSPSQPHPQSNRAQEEPLYFQQLLEYLRKRKNGDGHVDHDEHDVRQAEDDADTLIGCCA